MSTLHRPVALGTVATLLAAVALVGISGTAHADESSLPGIDLTVPAADVTDTDSNLASAAREVVAIVDGPDGPEVLKLRAQTQAEAAVLAAELDSRPEVTAETNRVFTTPTVDTSSTGPAKPAGSFNLTDTGGYRTSSVYALGAEPFGVDQWGLSAVHADGAWTVTRGGGVTVAVVDSGVDATHPDLAGRVLPQIDFVDDPWTGDPTGHGTHVAGIIAASLDGAGVAGLANEVNILPIRVMDATGSGDFLTIASGIVEAVDQGAKVINLSLGSAYSSDIIAAAVGYAVDSGVTVIAAGGNSYAEGNPVEYPAALPGVIAVSSVNRDGQSSVFANSGSYIDIAAPGEDILSTVPGGGWDYRGRHLDGGPVRGGNRRPGPGGQPHPDQDAGRHHPAGHRPRRRRRRRTRQLVRARHPAGRPGRPVRSTRPRRAASPSPRGLDQGEGHQREVQAARGREPEQGRGLLDLPGPEAARRRVLEAR